MVNEFEVPNIGTAAMLYDRMNSGDVKTEEVNVLIWARFVGIEQLDAGNEIFNFSVAEIQAGFANRIIYAQLDERKFYSTANIERYSFSSFPKEAKIDVSVYVDDSKGADLCS